MNASSAAVRRSRWRLASSAWRSRATSVPSAVPTVNITANVIRWRTSETTRVKRGGMKKKSYATTDSAAASRPGPRPPSAASMIANRYSMTSSGRSRRAPAAAPSPVATATPATART